MDTVEHSLQEETSLGASEQEPRGFTSNNLRIQFLASLVEEDGLFPSVESSRGFSLDERVVKRVLPRLLEGVLPISEQKLQLDDVRLMQRRVVKRLVSSSIITPHIAEIVGRIFRPSDVILREGSTGFSSSLSFDPERLTSDYLAGIEKIGFSIRGEATLDPRSVSRYRQILSRYARQSNASFPEEDVVAFAIGSPLSHEYGHAVETSLPLAHAQVRTGQDLHRASTILEAHVIHDAILHDFADAYPIPEDIEGWFDHEPTNRSYNLGLVSRERIAMSFERAYVLDYFVSHGRQSDGAALVASIDQLAQSAARDFVRLHDLVVRRGMSMAGVLLFMHRQSSRLSALLPDPVEQSRILGLSSASLGYAFPVEPSQLAAWVSRFEWETM